MASFQALTVHRFLLALLITLLFWLGYKVMDVFIVPIAWAGILAYLSWPAHVWLERRLPGRPNLAATLLTVGLTLLIVLPLALAAYMVQAEATGLYDTVVQKISQGRLTLPAPLQRLPFAADFQQFLDRLVSNPAALREQLQAWFQRGFGIAASVAGDISRNLFKAGMTLLTLFFFFRDGREILDQVRKALRVLIGERVQGYVQAIGDTTRAVVYGIVLTALAQGVLAGIGYAVAGVASPVLLAAFTTLIAMVPFGTPFAWGTVAIWLLIQGQTTAAIGLALWGGLVISWVDNIIRPLVISSATRISFLLVMFGVLGGLSAFGMIGLFLGPVILAVLMAIWRQWLESEAGPARRPDVP